METVNSEICAVSFSEAMRQIQQRFVKIQTVSVLIRTIPLNGRWTETERVWPCCDL